MSSLEKEDGKRPTENLRTNWATRAALGGGTSMVSDATVLKIAGNVRTDGVTATTVLPAARALLMALASSASFFPEALQNA